MIDTALYSILTGASAVTDLVSTRVYPVALPQGVTIPAIAFQRIGASNRILHHGGSANVAEGHFQITSLADDPLEAKTISEAVRQTLHGYKGTVDGEKIFFIRVENELDLFDPDLGNFQVVLDITINHRET